MKNPYPETPMHIQTTEAFVRFYVLLGQILDRALDESTKASFPEAAFRDHLVETKAIVQDLFATNRVVREKSEREYQRISQLANAYTANPDDQRRRAEVSTEREALKIKALVLSDLLAVFRSV